MKKTLIAFFVLSIILAYWYYNISPVFSFVTYDRLAGAGEYKFSGRKYTYTLKQGSGFSDLSRGFQISWKFRPDGVCIFTLNKNGKPLKVLEVV